MRAPGSEGRRAEGTQIIRGTFRDALKAPHAVAGNYKPISQAKHHIRPPSVSCQPEYPHLASDTRPGQDRAPELPAHASYCCLQLSSGFVWHSSSHVGGATGGGELGLSTSDIKPLD